MKLSWELIKRARDNFYDELALTCALHASLIHAPKDIINTRNILKELWSQIERTTSLRADHIWEWIPDGSASNLTPALMNACIEAVQAWDFTKVPNTTGRNDVERKETMDEQNIMERLIVTLSKFTTYQTDGDRNRDIVQATRALARQQALGGFPCKEQFLKKMNRNIELNRSSELRVIYVVHLLMYSVGLDTLNDISFEILQLWLADRQHWLFEDLADFA